MAATEVEVVPGTTTETQLVIAEGVPFVVRVPEAARQLGRMQLEWRNGNGALVRVNGLYEGQAGQDQPFRAPAGRYTLDVVDARSVRATTAFDLRANDPALVVELPLPKRDVK
jgi:hypothetical protein